MQSIQTEWRGHKFRSRLEARWAVAFEAMGIAWEYEYEGFRLGDGSQYLPDFLLHGLTGRHSGDLWVEVKGSEDDESLSKVAAFAKESPIYLVTGIPTVYDDGAWWRGMEDVAYHQCPYGLSPFNFMTVDGDCFGAYLGVGADGTPQLFGDDSNYLRDADDKATALAYQAASKARFEYGESPDDLFEFREAQARVMSLRADASLAGPGYAWDANLNDVPGMEDMRMHGPLPPGDYDFEVIGFRRSSVRNGKNAGANQAVYTLVVSDGVKSQALRHYIPLVTSAIWKAEQFFVGIGLMSPGSRVAKFPWDDAIGRHGRCHVESKAWGDVTRNEITRVYVPRVNR